jgi:hypothetical protein
MKRFTVVAGTLLAIMALALLAACSGGTFTDPGHESAGLQSGEGGGTGGNSGGTGGTSGGGGGSKPTELGSNASYSNAVDKLDEIIEYCEDHPVGANTSIKSTTQLYTSAIVSYKLTWNNSGIAAISTINGFIALLE